MGLAAIECGGFRMNIDPLLEEAFFDDEAVRATQSIELARDHVSKLAQLDAFSLEVVAPEFPDEAWLRERVLRPLIYFCQSTGAAPPACAGVFVTFFHRGRIKCVLGAEVLAWGAKQLGVDAQSLIDRYGTGEELRRAP
jgi:hypothetical protein